MKNTPTRHIWSVHKLMMIGCILVAVIAVARVLIIGKSSLNGAFLMVLICPLMHLLMMRHGSHPSKNESEEDNNNNNNSCH
jgi:hypothetical protein